MNNKCNHLSQELLNSTNSTNSINIRKIGIVSRDYGKMDINKFRDFTYSFKKVICFLNEQRCDSVLFSLYSIIKRDSFNVIEELRKIKINNIKTIFVEEFIDGNNRKSVEYVIYFKKNNKWKEHRINQRFGTLKYTKSFQTEIIEPFKKEVKRLRLLGNSTILLCGETNIVKYSKKNKKIEDKFNFLEVLDNNINVILNPIHDRMTRFEMKLKRQYLSKNNRWVVSVWNKGKTDKNGNIKDGKKPAWTIYYNGEEKHIEPIMYNILNEIDLEIGILDIK